MQLQKIPSAIKIALQRIVTLKSEAKNSENKLRSFFESSSVIHLLIGIDLKVIGFNRAAVNFMAKYHNIKLAVGLEVTKCIHPDHLQGFMKSYAMAIQGIPVRVERKLSYGDDTIIWFINYEPAMDGNGKILGMSFNAVDITEKTANEQKIMSQYHCLKEIAYIHSHSLRRPVTSLKGLMDMFRADNYTATKEGLLMLEQAIRELDKEVGDIENSTK